jgi:hypothetical protein
MAGRGGDRRSITSTTLPLPAGKGGEQKKRVTKQKQEKEKVEKMKKFQNETPEKRFT